MIQNKVGKKAVIMGTSGTPKGKVNLGAAVAMLGGVIGCGAVQVRYVLEYFHFRQKIGEIAISKLYFQRFDKFLIVLFILLKK